MRLQHSKKFDTLKQLLFNPETANLKHLVLDMVIVILFSPMGNLFAACPLVKQHINHTQVENRIAKV